MSINSNLPIHQVLPELLRTVASVPNTILQAPPGAGKTTVVPLALLEMLSPQAGRILMLEPRRLAAVSAARWMARTLGEEVGRRVGYSVRFDSAVSAATRVEVVTEGILTRRIQYDPLLEGVGMVIFDEFHERSLQADLGLALCLDVQRQVREDLKLLVMSATLEHEGLSRLLGGAPLVASQGRSFPVEEVYLEQHPHRPLAQSMANAVRQALVSTEGDILAFLPGSGEIRSCAARLREEVPGEVAIHPLYGDLPFDQQQAAIQPGARRKVVLATSIAETSLTIEGVRVVIDSGVSRRLRHDPASGLSRLVTVRESRASAEQRRGRAGRVAPGVCFRLFSQHSHQAMSASTPPEILEADLTGLVLELAAWGQSDPLALEWLDPPPAAPLEAARNLLIQLGGIDRSGRITPLGQQMSRLPLHPRLARLLLSAAEEGCAGLGCDLAALLSERDIILRTTSAPGGGHALEIQERLDELQRWRRSGQTASHIDRGALKGVERVAQQLRRVVALPSASPAEQPQGDTVGRLLLSAYPDRVAKRREPQGNRYLLSNGKGAILPPGCPGDPYPLLVALSVVGGDRNEAVIHLAAPLSEGQLRKAAGELLEERVEMAWSEREGRVLAVCEERLGALRLGERPYAPTSRELLPLVIGAVRSSSLGLLGLEGSFRQFQARVQLLRRCFPQEGWPDLSDQQLIDSLDEWLSPALEGVRTAQQLARVDCETLLRNGLEYRQRQALEELAPQYLTVPSGSRIRLDYCQGDLPVLAVKLQELFGLAQTPTVAAGRVEVLLHLLSPAGRPLQVTRDLKGFWNGGYQQVKKELKGRYPKHPWPDDPWSAVPTRRTKGRGQS